MVQARRVGLEAGELAAVAPPTAWPTLALAAAGLTLYVGTAYFGTALALPAWATLPMSTAAVYTLFTPMHDAAHHSVSREHRWLNEAVGWLCSIVFVVVPHPLFRWIHFRHHKHTNDPELDPDHIPVTHPLLLPMRLVATVANYMVYIKRNLGSLRRDTPGTLLHSGIAVCVHVASIAFATSSGFGWLVLQYWIWPALFGILILGFLFDYVPHHPHLVTRDDSLYGCTSTTDGFFSVDQGDSTSLLTWLMLGQNYHSVHHMYPTIPFYKYAQVWQNHKKSFLQAGVPVVSVFGRPQAPSSGSAVASHHLPKLLGAMLASSHGKRTSEPKQL